MGKRISKDTVITNEKYRKYFLKNSEKQKAALFQALDIRKFEIEMYWKRAAYFWTFIAAAFVAYGAIYSSNSAIKNDLAFILSCLGFVFSFAWFCVNRGSKYWQENWENHVDMLENEITGPLYKVTMSRELPTSGLGWFVHAINGPSRVSVSKINQIISLYVSIVWLFLILYSFPVIELLIANIWKETLLVMTIATCFSFLSNIGRTHSQGYGRVVKIRSSKN